MDLDHIAKQLATIEHSGHFVATGHHRTAPLLRIEGIGTLPLPIGPILLPALREASEVAPYGRGPDTVVDPDVRRCHQIDADRIAIPPEFEEVLAAVTAEAGERLGVADDVRSELYKLLIYGPGDFFVPHRDTEKAPGMFGTLVLTLPGEFDGGEMVVRHGEAAETVQTQSGPSGVRWAAFYSDCTHEVRPLASGVRVALVFNLIRDGAPTGPVAAADIADRVAAELQTWGPDDGVKVAYALDHRYSEEALGWRHLKGGDHGRAHALRLAASQAGLVAHLAMLSIDVEWMAEELQYRSRRRWSARYVDTDVVPDDLELYEVVRRDRLLMGFVDVDDQPTSMTPLPIEEDEIWPEGVIDDEQPDEISYYEATGNEGATLTKMYRRAVVVLWPPDAADALIAQRGLSAVLDAVADIDDAERVARLARGVLLEVDAARPDQVAALIRVLVHHELEALGVEVIERRRWLDRDLMAAVQAVAERLPESRAVELIASIADRVRDSEGLIGLVHHVARDGVEPERWIPILERLAAGVSGWRIGERSLSRLVELAWSFEHAGLQDSLFALMSDDGRFDVAVNAALELHTDGRCPEAWRARILGELKPRTAEPPTPPGDLRRDPPARCRCRDCQELAEFLGDPDSRTWTFAASKARRQHLWSVARADALDVDGQEVRTGNPHKLVLTKTNRRYERARDRFEAHTDARVALEV